MKILKHPNPLLNKKCSPVTKMDKTWRETIKEMQFLMQNEGGVGLSAPQVGILEEFFVWKFWPSVIVNPIITKKEGITQSIERCLSIREIDIDGKEYSPQYIVPRRAKSITIEGFDIKGREFTKKYTGVAAIVVQHEMDHLQGLLITRFKKVD